MDSEPLVPPKPSHITCPACQQVKERSKFKRLASLAQTRTWLNNPTAGKRLWYVGKVCNACNPKRRAKEIAPSELEKILIRNETNTDIIKTRLENRKALGSRNRSKGAIKALQQRRLAHFDRHKAEITRLTSQLNTRVSYLNNKLRRIADPADYDLMRYLRYASMLCKSARQTMTREGRAGHAAPVHWQAVIKPDDIVTLQQLHNKLDGEHKVRVFNVHNTLTAPVSHEKIDDVERRKISVNDSTEPKAPPPAWLIFGEQEEAPKTEQQSEPAFDLSWADDLLK
jgi:hypothetical protein